MTAGKTVRQGSFSEDIAQKRVRRGAQECRIKVSGRGAAWLARLLGVQEVPGSNPGGPTKFLKDLQTPDLPQPGLWSPTGVQIHRFAFGHP